MISINIKATVSGRKKIFERQLPTSWDELAQQYKIPVTKALMSTTEVVAKLRALKIILNLPEYIWHNLGVNVLSEVLDELEWLKLQANPSPIIDSFIYKGRTYFFPKASFENGTGWEFAVADEYYSDAAKNASEDDLLHLAATLCRPANDSTEFVIKTGDIREPLSYNFSQLDIRKRADHFKALPTEIRIIVLLYFSGVKEYVVNNYGDFLFQQPADQSDQQTGELAPQFGWWSTFHSIAEDGVFGPLDTVHKTNFHQLAMYLVDRQIKAEKLQKEYDKMNSKS